MNPYSEADSEIAGPFIALRPNTVGTVMHRTILSTFQRFATVTFGVVLLLSYIAFWAYAVNHLHFPAGWKLSIGVAALVAFFVCETLRLVQGAFLVVCTWLAKNPVPMTAPPGLRVAILTTIVPSKEPLHIVAKTLAAMRKITYPGGTVDVWILDEGDDDDVKATCAELGVKHFTRKGKPQYHQDRGPFRTKTKAGNHNSWRDSHEADYDVVAQMDPDHTPFPNFLERTLGYFRDPNVGFVVAPQVYGNLNENFVAKGAAEHAFIFHGIVQRAGGVIGSPVLIGTNHLYRATAWSQMGGYQDSIIEDHRTSITLNSLSNPATGERWKGVYTPDILSVGEGPSTWADYFTQQERWAYGIAEILFKYSPTYLPKQKLKNALFYLGIESFYPGVAITFILSLFLCAVTVMFGTKTAVFLRGDMLTVIGIWAIGLVSQIRFFTWIQRFNLTATERASSCKTAMLATLVTAPVYTAAFVQFITGKRIDYIITPKGEARTAVSLSTFTPHLVGMLLYLPIILAAGVTRNASAAFWSMFTFLTLVPLPLMALASHFNGAKIMRSIRTATAAMFVALVLALFVPATASAQSVYYPGQVYTMNGTLSPAEPGNKVSMTTVTQGVAKNGLEVYGTLTAWRDTAGFDWNRRVIDGIGTRYTLPLNGGFVRAGVAYLSEKRFVYPQTINGLSVSIDAWFGWNQRAAQAPPTR